jgi:hypothetical protein
VPGFLIVRGETLSDLSNHNSNGRVLVCVVIRFPPEHFDADCPLFQSSMRFLKSMIDKVFEYRWVPLARFKVRAVQNSLKLIADLSVVQTRSGTVRAGMRTTVSNFL